MDHNQHIDEVFEANSKSVLVAYLLWFFFGLLSVHRFYAGKTKSGVVRLAMLFSVIGIPILALLWIVDLFLIPSMIGEQNLKTINLINAGAAANPPALPQDDEPASEPVELDSKRKAMLEDLRKRGYRKERRDDFSELYR